MKSVAVVVLLFLVALGSARVVEAPGGPVHAAKNTWKLTSINHISGSAVPVSCVRLDDGRWQTLFLTARHVVIDQPETDWSVNQDSDRWIGDGTVLSQHPLQDAALVLFWSLDPVAIVLLNAQAPTIGDRVWAIGYPLGQNRMVSEGIVSNKNSATTNVYYGNSGGPVVDLRGSIVGLVSAMRGRRTPVHHLMVMVSISDLVEWLESHGVKL